MFEVPVHLLSGDPRVVLVSAETQIKEIHRMCAELIAMEEWQELSLLMGCVELPEAANAGEAGIRPGCVLQAVVIAASSQKVANLLQQKTELQELVCRVFMWTQASSLNYGTWLPSAMRESWAIESIPESLLEGIELDGPQGLLNNLHGMQKACDSCGMPREVNQFQEPSRQRPNKFDLLQEYIHELKMKSKLPDFVHALWNPSQIHNQLMEDCFIILSAIVDSKVEATCDIKRSFSHFLAYKLAENRKALVGKKSFLLACVRQLLHLPEVEHEVRLFAEVVRPPLANASHDEKCACIVGFTSLAEQHHNLKIADLAVQALWAMTRFTEDSVRLEAVRGLLRAGISGKMNLMMMRKLAKSDPSEQVRNLAGAFLDGQDPM